MRIIMLGAPGSGKGTVAAQLSATYDTPHISTGDLFRQHIQQETALGKQAETYIRAGQLVPDDVTIRMVTGRLQQPDCLKGFILDGFPRTPAQADALADWLSQKGLATDLVINLFVPDQVILDRISQRRVCACCGCVYNLHFRPPCVEGVCDRCGGCLTVRADDQPATVLQRLETYRERTAPLIAYYKDKKLLLEVDNERSSTISAQNIIAFLAGRR